MIPDFAPRGEQRESVDPLTLAAELILPSAGARVISILGGGTPVGHVFLAPRSGLTKHDREQVVSAHPFVNCSIRAEAPHAWQEPPQPVDFHHETLCWMLRRADYISIWSAPFPQLAEEHTTAGIQAIADGAKFTVTIETTPEGEAEWAALARHWKRKAAKLVIFGPENAEPVAGAADMPPPVVPDDVVAERGRA